MVEIGIYTILILDLHFTTRGHGTDQLQLTVEDITTTKVLHGKIRFELTEVLIKINTTSNQEGGVLPINSKVKVGLGSNA